MIRFICACGKHLRARDDMARRRSACPACGRPVGVPTLAQMEGPPALAPLSRLDPPASPSTSRLTSARTDRSADLPRLERVLDVTEVQPRVPKKPASPRRGSDLEPVKALFSLLPFRAVGPSLALALLLTLVAALSVQTLAGAGPGEGSSALVVLLLPLAVLCYIGAYWYSALVAALGEETQEIPWPGSNLAIIARGVLRCLVSFLAGPALLLGAAFWYWLHGGDFTALDWLLFFELLVVAVVYWLFAFVAVTANNRLSGVAPLQVLELVRTLGVAATIGAAVCVTLIVLFHGAWGWRTLQTVQKDDLGWFFLCLCSFSGQCCMLFLLRWLGARYGRICRQQRLA
jgi:hypothetical protein